MKKKASPRPSHYLPTMFPPEQDQVVASKLLACVKTYISPDCDLPMATLFELVAGYRRDLAEYHRDGEREFQEQAQLLRRTAKEFSKALEACKLLHVRIRRRWVRDGLDAETDAALPEFMEKLTSVIQVCEGIKPNDRATGRPPKVHVDRAVQKAVQIWHEQSKLDFNRNYRTAKGSKRKTEFVSPGPLFVQQLLANLEPSVSLKEVRSALKSLLSNDGESDRAP